jgi:hypothetical protein
MKEAETAAAYFFICASESSCQKANGSPAIFAADGMRFELQFAGAL